MSTNTVAPEVDASPIMTLREASAFLRIPEQTLKNWRSTGKPGPPALKFGALLRYHRDQLEQWMFDQAEVR